MGPFFTQGLRALAGWLGDCLRLAWALGYWNVRKSWYRLRPGRSYCPCQDQSDSGIAGQIGCVACENWSDPARFRAVCPLLVRTEKGWKCSVAAAQVRPFWGRAAGFSFILAGALFLGGTLTAWQGLRQLGHERLAWTDVAWPGHWDRIGRAQAERYRDDGYAAFQAKDYRRALLAFSAAYQIDPTDYDSALLLARLLGYSGSYASSDQVFEEVLRRFPERAGPTARVYHEMLLGAQRLRALAWLSLRRLVAGPANARLWEHSLLYALGHGRFAEAFARDHAARIARLPVPVSRLVAACAAAQTDRRDEARRLLADFPVEAERPHTARQAVELLTQLGFRPEAEALLRRSAGVLGAFETTAQEYLIAFAAAPAGTEAQADFLALLAPPLDAAKVDRLCALVIQTRDAAALRRLRPLVRQPALADQAEVIAALWAAAAIGEDYALLAQTRALPVATRRGLLPDIEQIDLLATSRTGIASLRFVVNAVPLPRETVLALIARAMEARRADRAGQRDAGQI